MLAKLNVGRYCLSPVLSPPISTSPILNCHKKKHITPRLFVSIWNMNLFVELACRLWEQDPKDCNFAVEGHVYLSSEVVEIAPASSLCVWQECRYVYPGSAWDPLHRTPTLLHSLVMHRDLARKKTRAVPQALGLTCCTWAPGRSLLLINYACLVCEVSRHKSSFLPISAMPLKWIQTDIKS